MFIILLLHLIILDLYWPVTANKWAAWLTIYKKSPGWFIYCESVMMNVSKYHQPEHVSEAERCDAQLNIPLCVCAHMAKANAPLMIRSRSPLNQIPLRSHSHII